MGTSKLFLLLMLGSSGFPCPMKRSLPFGYLSFKGDLHVAPSLLMAFLGTACGITVSYELR